MPTSLEDLVILLDAQMEVAPIEIRDDWRRVRGWLRQQRRRPSSMSLPAVQTEVPEPDTKRHFKAVGEILGEVNNQPKDPV